MHVIEINEMSSRNLDIFTYAAVRLDSLDCKSLTIHE